MVPGVSAGYVRIPQIFILLELFLALRPLTFVSVVNLGESSARRGSLPRNQAVFKRCMYASNYFRRTKSTKQKK